MEWTSQIRLFQLPSSRFLRYSPANHDEKTTVPAARQQFAELDNKVFEFIASRMDLEELLLWRKRFSTRLWNAIHELKPRNVKPVLHFANRVFRLAWILVLIHEPRTLSQLVCILISQTGIEKL